jgi:succinate dehydrogenase / fumarate reductase membrane anchor subunit
MLFELLSKRYPGMRQWLTQRLSALVLAGYIVLFIGLIVIKQPASFTQWTDFFQPTWWRVLTLVFFTNLLIHAWLGVGNVLKDYIFNVKLRVYVQMLVEMLVAVELVWMVKILWRM